MSVVTLRRREVRECRSEEGMAQGRIVRRKTTGRDRDRMVVRRRGKASAVIGTDALRRTRRMT